MKAALDRWRSGLKMAGRPDENEVKRLLASLGLAVPEGLRAVCGALDQPPPFGGPYALKVCSPDVLHKTDVQGVYLNLDINALDGALRRLASDFPDTPVLIEQMVVSNGPEMIVGGLMDPSLGPAIMVGTGGILTEIVPDVAFRLAPLDEAEAHRMLAELSIYPVFEGYRGLDLDADELARLLATVSRMVDAWGAAFDQLDLNPVVWTGETWMILDAKLVLTC
jgi:hypothetical protein